MRLIGNILWFILGGFLAGLTWLIAGVFWCITIVGIPYGKQCFKFAALACAPFGKDVEFGGGTASTIANIIWTIFFGIPMAIECFIAGITFCITLIGIPFGIQYFKLGKLSFAPFGAKIVKIEK